MTFGKAVRQVCQALFFPQSCVLCRCWVLDPDLSSLCAPCFRSLKSLDERVCYACGIPLPGDLLAGHGWCSQCRVDQRPYDFARAYGPYEGNLRRVIQHFKFKGCRRLAFPLSALLEVCYREKVPPLEFDWIVPVPLHAGRRRARGFDQALLLSQVLSRAIKIPVLRALERVKATTAQSGLDLQERRKNVRGAFSLVRTHLLRGRNILLVDDVMTTGITVSEICCLLRDESEIGSIVVLTVARVPLWYPVRTGPKLNRK